MSQPVSKAAFRFAWCMCVLLVIALCGLIVAWSPAPSEPGLADQFVVERPLSPGIRKDQAVDSHSTGSVGSTPAAGVVEVATSPAHALDPALRLARDALARFRASVDDYTAIIIKRERIGGSLGGESRMEMKVRTRRLEGDKVVRPLQVYLKFLDPWLARGREVIWVENRSEGKLVAHEGGLKNVMRVALLPTDKLAMMGNKYPITEIGLEKLIEKLIEKGERDKLAGPCDVKIVDGFEVGGRPCQKIEVTHPNPDPRFDFHIAQIFLDTERMIPLRYAAYLWPEKPGGPPQLEEEYTYLDVKLNVGLTDSDFDPDNPAYNYP